MLLTFCPHLLWEPYTINIANIANISPLPTSQNMLHLTPFIRTVVVGRPEGVFSHGPPGREDDKVADGHALDGRGAGQHGEDARVGVVERDGVHHAELGEVIL